MAAEAVMKVREAEEKGGEMLKKAGEDAREIVRKAEADGEAERKSVIGEAYAIRDKMIKTAQEAAAEECASLTLGRDSEIAKVLNPDQSKLERAANMIIERIVK